ncbi:type IIL restriction-modification enzyme MmeI, partial [Corallococcus terminator]|uniref:type IIL restriction-modification enzyme MmeI n=1 Tax=Corallococcus terminator TaxID=2316733 RepID=UPI0011C4644D
MKQNIKGHERAEAQTFLDRLFRAFGHPGAIEAGARFEDPIKRLKGDKKSTSFADLVWRPRVLIEMKARGEQLRRHTNQAFEYWKYLVPNRPRWVILCNFDELWVYDFETEVEEPVDRITLAELPVRAEVLAFLKPELEKPVFGVNRVEVTRDAAARVAATFNSMTARGLSREVAQRFVLQCVMALFSEDLRLLPSEHFTRILQNSLGAKDPGRLAYLEIGDLFRQMNNSEPATSGPNKKV